MGKVSLVMKSSVAMVNAMALFFLWCDYISRRLTPKSSKINSYVIVKYQF
jgi:hypothetical protein